MTVTDHILALAVVLAASALLVLFPRKLYVEVSGRAPSRRRDLSLAAALVGAGIAAIGLSGDLAPVARIALALCIMALTTIIYSDLSFLVVPDLCVIMLAGLALAAPWRLPLLDAALGAAVCGGLLGLLALGWRRTTGADGLGWGDVKLAAAAGALLGAQTGLIVISVSAAITAALVLAFRLLKRNEQAMTFIPYGASLALASGCALAGSLS